MKGFTPTAEQPTTPTGRLRAVVDRVTGPHLHREEWDAINLAIGEVETEFALLHATRVEAIAAVLQRHAAAVGVVGPMPKESPTPTARSPDSPMIGRMKLDPKPVVPTGSHTTMAFVARTPPKGSDEMNCNHEPFKMLEYPPSEMAAWFSTTCHLLGIGLSAQAKALDLTVVQVSDLCRGSASLTPDEWKDAARRLAKHAEMHPVGESLVNLPLTEEQRQLVLLALARLALEHPGFDDALNGIALGLDNNVNGRAEMYDGFRVTLPWLTPRQAERTKLDDDRAFVAALEADRLGISRDLIGAPKVATDEVAVSADKFQRPIRTEEPTAPDGDDNVSD